MTLGGDGMNEDIEKQTSEAATDAADNKKIKEVREITDLYDWLQCIVSALVVCILLFTFVARTCGVVGPSMENTLYEGERLIISNLFYTPRQGDIVIFRKDSFRDEPIVKRIIALEGQKVDIDFIAGAVYVDGELLEEDYIKEPTYRSLDFEGEITVPEGCVFVLGDNRNHSNDSRDALIGCVDTRYIIGKAYWRIAPIERFGSLYE